MFLFRQFKVVTIVSIGAKAPIKRESDSGNSESLKIIWSKSAWVRIPLPVRLL